MAGQFRKLDSLSTLYGNNVWEYQVPDGAHAAKMEYMFGVVKSSGAKRVFVCGGTGSNLCVTAAEYGKKHDIPVHCLMIRQPISSIVKNNLMLMKEAGAQIHLLSMMTGLLGHAIGHIKAQFLIRKYKKLDGVKPFVILPGGVNTLGVKRTYIEYLDMLEAWNEQPEAEGQIDTLFIAVSSGGNTAALLAALHAMDTIKHTTVNAVRVADKYVCNKWTIRYLLKKAFPEFKVTTQNLILLKQFLGQRYGDINEASRFGSQLAAAHGVVVDPVYTAKAMTAMHYYLIRNTHKNVVFVNTYNKKTCAANELEQTAHLSALLGSKCA